MDGLIGGWMDGLMDFSEALDVGSYVYIYAHLGLKELKASNGRNWYKMLLLVFDVCGFEFDNGSFLLTKRVRRRNSPTISTASEVRIVFVLLVIVKFNVNSCTTRHAHNSAQTHTQKRT